MPNEEKLPIRPAEKPPELEKAPKEAPALEVPEKPAVPVKEAPGRPVPVQPVVPVAAPPKEPVLRQIEAILAEDLEAVYAGLPPELKPKFRAKGEEVAHTIREMLKQAKVKTQKILKLIINWLKMVPGVNRFFIEQEAAIKTQRILFLSEHQKEK